MARGLAIAAPQNVDMNFRLPIPIAISAAQLGSRREGTISRPNRQICDQFFDDLTA
jgi:hypothetical protein